MTAPFSSRPRPSKGDWEQMLADEHAQGLHGDDCGCTATNHTNGRSL